MLSWNDMEQLETTSERIPTEVVSVYMTKPKAESLRALAEAEGRSLSNFLNRIIDEALRSQQSAGTSPASSAA